MDKKKICVITSVHTAFDTRIFHRECRTLADAGYKVVLVVPHERDEEVNGIIIKALHKSQKSSRLWRMTWTVWQAFQEAMRQNADVYHFHDRELIPVGLLLRANGKRVIYDVHEHIVHILHKHWLPIVARKTTFQILKLLELSAAKRLSAIITADKEIAQCFYEVNDYVVPLKNYPIIEEFPSDVLDDMSRYTSGKIVSFGGIIAERSIRELIGAMELIPQEFHAKLTLGGVSHSETLCQEIRQMPGWRDVDYHGKVPWHAMVELLTHAAIGIILYSPLPNHFDVRSNRLFESLAAGLPVIVSHFPKWREIVEGYGCGLAVDPEKPQAIAEALIYLLSHPQEAAAMGCRARWVAIEKFNWAREQPKLLQLYEHLLDAG